ncbi:MAG: undecaprenyl-diphosphate phosphatase [Pseudomonadota bacterium]
METLGYGHAIILGLLEGFTEFLPISSTGHLIIANDLLGVNDARGKAFAIFIQLGAVLAVCAAYRDTLVDVARGLAGGPGAGRARALRFCTNLLLAFLPAMLLGALLHGFIKAHLFSPVTVACALVVGGVVILWVESRGRAQARARVPAVDDMGWRDALKVGLCQCCALFPGVSRSGATIIGGMLVGLSREAATRFSFFLALPTMFAAVTYDLYRNRHLLEWADAGVFATGFLVAFVTALLTVRALLAWVARRSYAVFGWYRIALGLIVLAYFA